MSVIQVRCTDQVLAYENTPVIASGGLEENFITFEFCSQWDGFDKTAVFWRSEDEVYHNRLDTSNTCQVPPEVTADDGVIWLGVFAVDGAGRQRTSEALSYRIVKGAITTDTKPSDPTPDIYTQILSELLNIRELAEQTKAQEEAFEAEMTQQQNTFEAAVTASLEEHVEDVAEMQAQHVAAVEAEMEAFKNSMQAGAVEDGSITAAKLADGSVTTPKLAYQAVTAAKIAEGAVTSPKILSGAVTVDKLAGDVFALIEDVVKLHVWELKADEGTYFASSYNRNAYTEGASENFEATIYFAGVTADRAAITKIGSGVTMRTCFYDDLVVASDGSVTMGAYATREVTEENVLYAIDYGPYFMIEPVSGYETEQYTDLEPGVIYWLPNNVEVSTGAEGNTVYIDGYDTVTHGIPGLTNVVISYIGQLGRRTAAAASGEYTGTGSAQTLTFDFEPKYVSIVSDIVTASTLGHYRANWTHGIGYGEAALMDDSGASVPYPSAITATGNTLTISDSNLYRSNVTYHYVAIG